MTPDVPAAIAPDAAPAPQVSVIVPVYRHWDLVPDLLAALAAQDFRDFELLLVDNAPDEPRPDLVLHPALPVPARILGYAAPGSYAARNAGIAAARGRLGVTTRKCSDTILH